MKIKFLSALVCCLVIATASDVQAQNGKADNQQNITSLQVINERISDLMADHVGLRQPLATASLIDIDYLSEDNLVESEELMFPADELYGSWDTLWVNPFRTKTNEIDFPDTFNIDCQAFVIPIDVDIKVTSKYGPRRRRMHKGIDLKVQKGDTIRAAFSGKVRIRAYERRGYGYYLVLRHPNGLETVYGHLSKFLVEENAIVTAGMPIGLGGSTGRSTGTHLHFETRFLGQALNPADIIDFESGKPYERYYTVYKHNFGNSGNIYTSTSEHIVYHRVKQGETLGKIALLYNTTVNELCRLNGLKRTSTLRIGQTIRCGTTNVRAKQETVTASTTTTPATTTPTPTATASETVAATPAEIETETSALVPVYHTIQQNETLSSIARKYNTTVDALCKLNNIYTTDKIKAGDKLCYKMVKPATAQTTEAKADTPTNKAASPVYYRIQKGDTLSSIARKHGLTVDELCKFNNITSTTVLQVGRSLRCS